MGSANALLAPGGSITTAKCAMSSVGVRESTMEMRSTDEEVSALFQKPQDLNLQGTNGVGGGGVECRDLWKPARISIFHVKGASQLFGHL